MTLYLAAAAVTAGEESAASAVALGEMPDRWRSAVGHPRKGSTAASIIDQLVASPVLTDKTAAGLSATSDRRASSLGGPGGRPPVRLGPHRKTYAPPR